MVSLGAARLNIQPERDTSPIAPRRKTTVAPRSNPISASLSFVVKKARRLRARERVVRLKTSNKKCGNALLSYMTGPFLVKPGKELPHHHSNLWECWQIAQTLLDIGYDVDVIESDNKFFVPRKNYTIAIEHRFVLSRIAERLGKSCLKINHIDTAHPIFNNYAEAERLLMLQVRRGVTLAPQRSLKVSFAYETSDCATIVGNDFTMSTYHSANKPIVRTPISVPFTYPWPQHKNFSACRRRFLWFGSGGLVHKGLDLVLEAFARMPEMELIVCGPVDAEPAFMDTYRYELTELPNISLTGWVDIGSQEFLDITQRCVGVVSVSCSEGGCGAVITAMHAGLIPIVNRESAVDVESFGTLLQFSSIDAIVTAVRALADLPEDELQDRARLTWEHVRRNHTQESFAKSYRSGVCKLLDWKGLAYHAAPNVLAASEGSPAHPGAFAASSTA